MMPFKVIGPLFRANMEAGIRVFVNQGGTSSGKTYTLMQLMVYYALSDVGCVITVAGQDIPNLKVGAIRDFKSIVYSSNVLSSMFKFNESSLCATCYNGSLIEFKSYDDEQDAKSGKRDYLFVNEANGISYPVYWQLAIRTRKRVYIDYNPSELFWVHENVKGGKGVKVVISDHRGNPFLTEEEHARIENITDRELWRVYARGLTGKLSGVIFPNVNYVDDIPYEAVKVSGYGLDFGFTNDPTALIKCAVAHGELWLDETIYSTGLTNPDIARLAKERSVSKADLIVADCAEPKSIKELNNEGLWVVASPKGKDSLLVGIDTLKRYKINVTRRSKGLRTEFQNYKWKINKDGNETNTPIDKFNHGIDAVRYFGLKKLNVVRKGRAKAHYNRLD